MGSNSREKHLISSARIILGTASVTALVFATAIAPQALEVFNKLTGKGVEREVLSLEYDEDDQLQAINRYVKPLREDVQVARFPQSLEATSLVGHYVHDRPIQDLNYRILEDTDSGQRDMFIEFGRKIPGIINYFAQVEDGKQEYWVVLTDIGPNRYGFVHDGRRWDWSLGYRPVNDEGRQGWMVGEEVYQASRVK